MEKEIMPFLRVYRDLYQRNELTMLEVFLYSVMHDKYTFYRKAKKEFRPSVHYLAVECKCSERSIISALNTLKKLGLIVQVSRGNRYRGLASEYTVRDYTSIANTFTRPSTSDIYKAERAARGEAVDPEPVEQEQAEPEAVEQLPEPETDQPAQEPIQETLPEAPQDPLSPPPVQPQAEAEKTPQEAIQEQSSPSIEYTLEENARLYLRGCNLPESAFMLASVMNSRNVRKLSDELFYKFIELGKTL